MENMLRKQACLNFVMLAAFVAILCLSGCSNGLPAPSVAVPTAAATAEAAAVPTLDVYPTYTVTGMPSPDTQPHLLAEGWTLYERPDESFAVELPDSWTQVDLNEETVQTIIDRLDETSPELGDKLGKLLPNAIASKIKFWAFDFTQRDVDPNEIATINVLQQPVAIPLPLDTFAKLTISMLHSTYGDKISKDIGNKTLHTPHGDVLLLSYTMQVTIQYGRTITRPVTQAIMMDKKNVYIMSMVASVTTSESYVPVFEAIAESFRSLK